MINTTGESEIFVFALLGAYNPRGFGGLENQGLDLSRQLRKLGEVWA